MPTKYGSRAERRAAKENANQATNAIEELKKVDENQPEAEHFSHPEANHDMHHETNHEAPLEGLHEFFEDQKYESSHEAPHGLRTRLSRSHRSTDADLAAAADALEATYHSAATDEPAEKPAEASPEAPLESAQEAAAPEPEETTETKETDSAPISRRNSSNLSKKTGHTGRTERLDLSELREAHQGKSEKELVAGITSWPAYGIITLVGILFSLTFYSFPFIHQLATPTQSGYLYSGFAMQHGQTPFNDFFGSGGLLFYLVNLVGNIGGSTIGLYILELLALVISGILTYRLVLLQTRQSTGAAIIAVFTMVAVAGLGRGGDAPTLFAFPFAVWAVKFLDAYFRKVVVRDEKFILFGLFAGITFVLSPLTFTFFAISAIALLVYNIAHFQIGRGIYQLLATVFGLLLIGYSIAYYALNDQTVYTSIEQSVIIPFTHFGIQGDVAMTLAISIVLILIFGLLTGFVLGLAQLKKASGAGIWYVFLLVGSVLVTLAAILTPQFDTANFLAVVPFVLVFQGRSLENAVSEHRNLLLTYLQNKLFAPIAALIFVFAAPFFYAQANHHLFAAEQKVATYVKSHTTDSDKVYVLAADKNINLLSQRLPSTDTPPASYPLKFKQTYDLTLPEGDDKLIILESGQKPRKSLLNLLKTDYKPIGSGKSLYTIYEKK